MRGERRRASPDPLRASDQSSFFRRFVDMRACNAIDSLRVHGIGPSPLTARREAQDARAPKCVRTG
ncbi:hypothetical protein [Burkholderia dolosa]|uniref:hypothetical protein n=1 Tax=Burkholderia dolosa TaxID=152500 RepID=UPI001B991E17|nr:hypothetical protein [Burkholderia dolosa]MBR8058773.1 hypothetical protein [Burkholderia dolosa]MBR8302217.1 hypothetical protein [Burkholderia dolosa]MBY4832760.1 hypothetical protein [Burkholderia dolosa]